MQVARAGGDLERGIGRGAFGGDRAVAAFLSAVAGKKPFEGVLGCDCGIGWPIY